MKGVALLITMMSLVFIKTTTAARFLKTPKTYVPASGNNEPHLFLLVTLLAVDHNRKQLSGLLPQGNKAPNPNRVCPCWLDNYSWHHWRGQEVGINLVKKLFTRSQPLASCGWIPMLEYVPWSYRNESGLKQIIISGRDKPKGNYSWGPKPQLLRKKSYCPFWVDWNWLVGCLWNFNWNRKPLNLFTRAKKWPLTQPFCK